MAHTVTFSVPERSLGREDIEFVVMRDGVRFGTLLVSKGAVEWRPTNKVLPPSPALGALRSGDARKRASGVVVFG